MCPEESAGDDAPEPDDAPSGPPPDPLDRPWVHPSELRSFIARRHAAARAPAPRVGGRHRLARSPAVRRHRRSCWWRSARSAGGTARRSPPPVGDQPRRRRRLRGGGPGRPRSCAERRDGPGQSGDGHRAGRVGRRAWAPTASITAAHGLSGVDTWSRSPTPTSELAAPRSWAPTRDRPRAARRSTGGELQAAQLGSATPPRVGQTVGRGRRRDRRGPLLGRASTSSPTATCWSTPAPASTSPGCSRPTSRSSRRCRAARSSTRRRARRHPHPRRGGSPDGLRGADRRRCATSRDQLDAQRHGRPRLAGRRVRRSRRANRPSGGATVSASSCAGSPADRGRARARRRRDRVADDAGAADRRRPAWPRCAASRPEDSVELQYLRGDEAPHGHGHAERRGDPAPCSPTHPPWRRRPA